MAAHVVKKKSASKSARRPSVAVRQRSKAEARSAWLKELRAHYTPAVCAKILELNESLRLYGET